MIAYDRVGQILKMKKRERMIKETISQKFLEKIRIKLNLYQRCTSDYSAFTIWQN